MPDDETMQPVLPVKRATTTRKKPSTTAKKASSKGDGAIDLAQAISSESLMGGKPRQTLPINANVLGVLPWAFLPRRQYQDMDLTSITPGSFSPQQLIDVLSDADQDVSLALWNFLRLSSDYKYEVRTQNNEDEDVAGKAALDLVITQINRNWGGFDNLLLQWIMSTVLEGACAGETIPNEDIDDVDDIIAVQPWTIYFQRDISQNYLAFQWQPMLASGSSFVTNPTASAPSSADLLWNSALNHGGFRLLNEITFAYVPLDSPIDDPYGRMPFGAILQIILFDSQLIKDLRQWSHINAFSRIDVSVVAKMVEDMMPPAIRNDKNERTKFFNSYLRSVQSAYNQLDPDATYVHYDNVVVSSADSSGGTMQIDNLIRVVERRKFRALKQLPILMGSNESSTETHGTVQMEIYTRGVAAIHHVVASLAERLLNVALRLKGFNSIVHFKFDTLRPTDRIKDATAESVEIKNAAAKRDQGWITQDEAAIDITGSKAVKDGPQPDPMVASDQPDQGSNQPMPTAPASPSPDDNAKGDEEDQDAIKEAQDKADPDAGKKTSNTAKKTGKTTKASLTASEREALERALVATLTEHASELMRSSKEDAPAIDTTHRLPSKARLAIVDELTDKLAERFRAQRVSEHVISQASELFNNSKYTKSGRLRTRLTDKQRDSLRASVAQVLIADFPDDDQGMADILEDSRINASDQAGQEAIELIGLAGTFALTSHEMRQALTQTVMERLAGIQNTTRQRLATAITNELEADTPAGDITDIADGMLSDMADGRAAIIAQTETADAWFDTTGQAWQRNGIDMWVWTTAADPDPHAGATGETPCRDNSYAGAVRIGDPFPSGDTEPPAHSNCVCGTNPVGDPSDAAMADPWLGD